MAGLYIIIGNTEGKTGKNVIQLSLNRITKYLLFWMYPWDSPFRERWYSVGHWKEILTEAGFEVQHCQRILNPGDRGWRRFVRMNGFFLLTVRKI
jgi:hypothetical protein